MCNYFLGELLDLNFKSIIDSNKKKILVDMSIFGIAMSGDGVTVHHMPLLNILCISGEQPPVVLGIEITQHTWQMEAQRMYHI